MNSKFVDLINIFFGRFKFILVYFPEAKKTFNKN